ncbi:MAG TPA: glycerol-3-phosphate 1-O-acyltransferase PlsY [Burkholderiales bacterium]|nr:glycerol-3-phosphate 1-O-acyltransferase PlsY [Burkholderiales bacterium]
MQTALAIVGAYLLGSISFAVLVSKLMGLPDPHTYGSKNPGATNVLRTGSKAAALLTLIGDSCKGAVAVLLAAFFVTTVPLELALVGLAAFLGHLYPVFHRFQGGKGVATAAGVLLALDWRVGVGTLLTWGIIALFLRYSSLAALVAALFAPIGTIYLLGWQAGVVVAVMSAFLVWRHKGNIERLLAGTEPRIGAKKATPSGPSAA